MIDYKLNTAAATIKYKAMLPSFRIVKEPSMVKIPMVTVTSSIIADEYFRKYLAVDMEVLESFHVLLLNQANKTIGHFRLAAGGISGVTVDLRLLGKMCINSLAVSCIVAHNHPSGNRNPSRNDDELTARAKAALEMLDVKLLDHLIITADNGYHSYADEGKM